jgi:WD40 repeat protein
MCAEILFEKGDIKFDRSFFDQSSFYDPNELHKIARDLALLEYSLQYDSHINEDFIARTRLLVHFNDELRKFISLDKERNLGIYFEERKLLYSSKLRKDKIQSESEQMVKDEINKTKSTVLAPREKYTITPKTRQIVDMLISPDNQYLALKLVSGGIQVKELLNNRELYSRSLSSPLGVVQLAFENDMLMANCYDHQAKIGNLEFGNLRDNSVVKSFVNNRSMNETSFSPNGKYFYTSEIPNAIDIRTYPSGEILYHVEHFQELGHIKFSEDSLYILTVSDDGRVKITALASGQEVDAFDLPRDQLFRQSISHSRFHPDGATLTLSSVKKIIVRDYIKHKNKITYKHPATARLFATNSDGNFNITGYQPEKVIVRNIQNGQENLIDALSVSYASTALINGVEVLITGDSLGTIQVRNLETNELLYTVANQGRISNVILIPRTQYLIYTSSGETVNIVDLKTETTVYTIKHSDMVSELKLSQDGRYLVSLSVDGMMKVTDLFSFSP